MASQVLDPFPMKNEKQFGRDPPPLSERIEVGSFTLTGPRDGNKRLYHDDRSGLRELHRRGPPGGSVRGLKMDLDKGFNTFISRNESENQEHLEHLLRWILAHPDEFLRAKQKSDIVCWRGRLQNLLCTPYERHMGWIMAAVRIDGLIYLTEFDTEKKMEERINPRDADSPRWQYWGYKFEQYMLNDPADKKAFEEPVNNFDGFHSVLTTKLDDVGLLFGAEMDGIDPLRKDAKPPHCYTELKTNKKIDTERQMRIFYDAKMRKWWAQSYIAGVPLVLVGFKDPNGVVTYTDEISINNAMEARLIRQQWSPAFCLNFLHALLSFIRKTTILDHKQAVYKYQWEPGWDRVTAEQFAPDSRYKFIPDWYLENRPRP